MIYNNKKIKNDKTIIYKLFNNCEMYFLLENTNHTVEIHS